MGKLKSVGIYACDNKSIAEDFGCIAKELHTLVIESNNTAIIDAQGNRYGWIPVNKESIPSPILFDLFTDFQNNVTHSKFISSDDIATICRKSGYDVVIINNVREGIQSDKIITDYIIFNNAKIISDTMEIIDDD